jgi:putative colanic acid biosynthesis glycosyltransferase
MPIRVSIVVATKNAKQLLGGLFESIAALPPGCRSACEVVVVDAASSDGTPAWLDRMAAGDRSPLLRFLSEPDAGIAEAWNKGVGLAQGEWVLFLGADDRVAEGEAFPAALAVLASASHQVAAVAFPIVVFGLPHNSSVVCTPVLGRNNATFQQVNTLPHQGVFHRREAWQRHGPFDTRLALAADYEFLLRLVSRGEPVVIAASLPPVLMAAGGISKQDPLRVLREFRFAQSLHGVAGVRWRWWMAWLKSIVRTITAAALGERTARSVSDGLRRGKMQMQRSKPAGVTTKWL